MFTVRVDTVVLQHARSVSVFVGDWVLLSGGQCSRGTFPPLPGGRYNCAAERPSLVPGFAGRQQSCHHQKHPAHKKGLKGEGRTRNDG